MSGLRDRSWVRWLRLGIGLAFLGQGFASGDAFAYGAGAFFSLQAILNTGCFAGACAPAPAQRAGKNDDLTHHQIE